MVKNPISSKTVSANILPLPAITSTPDNSVICLGQPVTLVATGANTYTWLPGNTNGSTVTYTPAGTGVYTVTGTDVNGCVNTSIVAVNVSACTGINALNQNSGFSLYPNPTNGLLVLKMNTTKATPVSISVMDVSGKMIIKTNFNFTEKSNATEINLERFANGIYFIKLVTNDNATQTIKVVKE